jgi:adenylate kinase family enzyme
LKKIIIFGNSAAGKSTLAKNLSTQHSLAHLDLDTLAWLPEQPPKRQPLIQSQKDIESFINNNRSWVIEGCYSDLLDLAACEANELIFLDLPIKDCLENAKSREWEPHKYKTKQAQDKNLEMLLSWISDYDKREDTFSRDSHQKLYQNFKAKKNRITSNQAFA